MKYIQVKEKARSLFELYLNVGMGDGWARQCALIAVDEILKMDVLEDLPLTMEYWAEVKKEIEKL